MPRIPLFAESIHQQDEKQGKHQYVQQLIRLKQVDDGR